MITREAITAWGVAHPWPLIDQVEQDLLLSRAICAIAAHDYLGNELVFRGGTALHKVHLDRPRRYSEDLDYVRSTPGGIAELTRALSTLGENLGFTVRTRISEHPKVYWRTTSTADTPIRIKIEVNTHERSPALPTTPSTTPSTRPGGTAQRRSRRSKPLNSSRRNSAHCSSARRVATCSTYGSLSRTSTSRRPTSATPSAPTGPTATPRLAPSRTSAPSSETAASAPTWTHSLPAGRKATTSTPLPNSSSTSFSDKAL